MGDAFQSGAAELIEWRWHRLRFASAPANHRQRKPSESCKERVFWGASSCADVRVGYCFDNCLPAWLRDFKPPAAENHSRLSSLFPQ